MAGSIRNVIEAVMSDLQFDLQAYDSASNFVVGYKEGILIESSEYGLYFGRTDALQMMLAIKA